MTTQTTTPTKLQNPIPSRPMATTIAQADMVIRTVTRFASSDVGNVGKQYEILHNILITPHEDYVVVTATDSYRLASAKVSRDLWTGDNDNLYNDNLSLVSVNALDGGAWIKAMEVVVPLGDGAYPNVDRLIHSTLEPTFSAKIIPLGGTSIGRDFNLSNLRKWGYWDGERRRPQGLIEFTYTDTRISYRFGMNLKGDARMPDATLWDGVTYPLADIVPATPTVQGVSSDITPKTLGAYNPAYLPDWQHVDTIRYHGDRRALYLAGGVFEYVVMPIMVPLHGEVGG